MTSVTSIWLACLLVAADSAGGSAPTPSPIRFRDVTAQTGITFQHTDGSSGRRYIVEYVSAGLATFDYDGDGLTDIYFVNGAPLPGTTCRQRFRVTPCTGTWVDSSSPRSRTRPPWAIRLWLGRDRGGLR